jgi:hypothetical protein
MVAICFLFDEILQVFGHAGQLLTSAVPHFALLVPARDYDPAWQPGARLTFELDEYSRYPSMVEAGPWLVRAGAPALDLEREGWTLAVSKKLQASPVQYQDLRTARTVFCTLQDGGLATLTVNSRTDESVGLTHRQVCQFLQTTLPGQIEDAFEFDSGGSVTLWADRELLNICSTLDENAEGQRPTSLARPIATGILLTEVEIHSERDRGR